MEKTYTTTNPGETQRLGELLAGDFRGGPASNRSPRLGEAGKTSSRVGRGGEIICLTGELGAGKTTFAQGVLKGLGAVGPYTSPTFVVLKQYEIRNHKLGIINVYHVDAYRTGPKDILDLGWEEIVSSKNNVIIVEWAERIKRIIPKNAVWIKFDHIKEGQRKITLS